MGNDNFTIVKVRATKICPQGQMPGEVFEVTQDVANVFILAECAEIVPTEPTKPEPDAKSGRGRYHRSDLKAED